MVSLLKTFGKGVLYVVGLPFFILALLLYAVFGLFAFLFQAIKSVVFFFTGQRFFPELPEDKELRLLKERAYQAAGAPSMEETPRQEENDIIFPFTEEEKIQEQPTLEEKPEFNTIEEACFNDTELDDSLVELEEEPSNEEPIEEDKQETVLQTAEPKQDEDDLVEELETYVPRSSNYSAADEDEDTDSGVDIDYDYKV